MQQPTPASAGRELIAVDWGTSRVRAALLSADGALVQQRESDDGILKVAPCGFEAVFDRLCGDWQQDAHGNPRLCLMSGMVGSRNGWREAPYAPCPAGFGELPQHLLWLQAGRHAIVPGLSCEHEGMPDVIRGEEVQVFGAMALLGLREATVVLPGTHSKWCEVRDGRIVRFRTCMTGEFHALLREHSILGRALPATDAPQAASFDRHAFAQGFEQAQRSASLLASAFSARSRVLPQGMAPGAVADYLSGLLIGEEWRAARAWQPANPAPPLVLVGSAALTTCYALALELGDGPSPASGVHRIGDEATWRGLWSLAQGL